MEELLFGAGLLFGLFYLGLILIYIIGVWNLYKKAGQPGWACIIPIYNVWVLLKIVGKPGWWILLLLIPLVNVVIGIIIIHNLSKSFGKDVAYTIGLIFLPMIFYPLLGLGNATYEGPAGLN
jgi:hypothetical protein